MKINLLHDANLEAKILALILNNQKISHQIIPYLTIEDFFLLEHQRLFQTFQILYEGHLSINDQSIVECAERNNWKNVDQNLLNTIYSYSAFEANLQAYLDKLINLAKLRQIQVKVLEINQKLNNKTNVNLTSGAIIDDLENLLVNVERKNVSDTFLTSKELSDTYFANLEKRKRLNFDFSGLATGYTLLDSLNQGLQANELIILAARPAMGKTAFALNIALNVANGLKKDNSKNVAFFSLEMSPEQLMGRIYGIKANIATSKLKYAKNLDEFEILKIQNAKYQQIDNLNLFIDDSGAITLNNLVWKCRRLHKIKPLDLIVIDYLQLINLDNKKSSENRQAEVAKISRSLKLLAKELNIPIIALSQLSRDVEKREDKKPMLADLRESGAIEQDADIVMFLYRENYYQKKKDSQFSASNYQSEPTIIDLIIAKNRNGANAEIKLLFDMSTGKFDNINWEQITRYSKGINNEEKQNY